MTQTKADAAVETAADKVETVVREFRAAGGIKAKIADALAEDPEFLRKLKPSLIVKRAKGEAPTNEPPSSPPPRPARPSTPRPKRPGGGGVNPWLVVGAAFAVGYVAAKVIDWRGHAHPRD
ncbi:MAG TPA: hypothetical protein VFA05_10405 [Gaiellaceae bacterium]|nr:hypothetical protein [Gaiellaceae bacterium]